MKRKGQFMIISAVIAGLITIALSSSITDIQSHTYEHQELPEHINQLRDEAERIAQDGVITQEEMRNFRKMTNYVEGYRVTADFNVTGNCVNIRLENPEQTAELPCVN
jgi:hypothetical protein